MFNSTNAVTICIVVGFIVFMLGWILLDVNKLYFVIYTIIIAIIIGIIKNYKNIGNWII